MATRYSTADIIKALQQTDGMVYLAAAKLGCCAQTIYTRAERVRHVQETIDAYRGKLLDIGELKLKEAVLAGQPWAVAFLLKTLGRKRGYVEKQEHELSGPGGGPIPIREIEELTDAELAAIARQVRPGDGGAGTPPPPPGAA